MIYFYAEDEFYYKGLEIEALLKQYDVKEIVPFPDHDDILAGAKKGDSIAFIAPYMPEAIDYKFAKTSFFEIIHLQNKHGVLTTGQYRLGYKEEDALKEKLGIKIHRSTTTMSDYGGAEILIEEAKKMSVKEVYGFPIKGFLLAGIPGTGKSYFAKCLAGETNRLLVELNLSEFMEQQDTIYKINMIFEYFIKNPGRYIIWIDEIEKMMVGEKSKQVLGVLLTRINDLNSEEDSNLFIIATANDITEIAVKNPEFLRNGRFDLLLFISSPSEPNAAKIFDMYIQKAIKKFTTDSLPILSKRALDGILEEEGTLARNIQSLFIEKISSLDYINNEKKINELNTILLESMEDIGKFHFEINKFIAIAQSTYREHTTSNKFIYTPAEIEFIVNDIFFSYYFNANFYCLQTRQNKINYVKIANTYKPLQVTLSDSISAMKGHGANFRQI